MTTAESFDSSIDPLDHLEGYRAIMSLQGAFDALLCVTFPITLKIFARIWFSGLQLGSISSFEQLVRLFVIYFDNNQIHLKNTNSLFTIKQQEGESLREDTVHFNIATLESKNFDKFIAMAILK